MYLAVCVSAHSHHNKRTLHFNTILLQKCEMDTSSSWAWDANADTVFPKRTIRILFFILILFCPGFSEKLWKCYRLIKVSNVHNPCLKNRQVNHSLGQWSWASKKCKAEVTDSIGSNKGSMQGVKVNHDWIAKYHVFSWSAKMRKRGRLSTHLFGGGAVGFVSTMVTWQQLQQTFQLHGLWIEIHSFALKFLHQETLPGRLLFLSQNWAKEITILAWL